MARFRGTIRGCQKEVSRLGGKESGIEASVNGWELGIRVVGCVNGKGEDEFAVQLTGGSLSAGSSKTIGTFTRADL